MSGIETLPAGPRDGLRALPRGEVHVWHAAPVADPWVADACVALLDPAERTRAAAFRFDRHRAEYVTAHALLRTVLSEYDGRPPEAWAFETGAAGKPHVAGDTDLTFNLSHADGAVCCAVARGAPVGVDVEWAGRDDGALEVAETYFAACEVEAVFARTGRDRMVAFLDRWTLKEAYVKSVGTGLRTDELTRIVCEVAADRRSASVALGLEAASDGGPWQFELWAPGPDHCAALAVRLAPGDAPKRVRYRRTVPTVRSWETDRSGALLITGAH